MANKKTYQFLFEHTTVVPFNEIQILQESKTSDGKSKLAYRCKLQESGVKNNNHRIYDDIVCESIVNQLTPKATNRSLLMEVDHPMFAAGTSDPMKAKQRATIVEINNCCAILRNISFKNGQVIGEMETLSGLPY